MAVELHWLYFVGYDEVDALASTPFTDYGQAQEYRDEYVNSHPGEDEPLRIYKAPVEVNHFDLKNAEV